MDRNLTREMILHQAIALLKGIDAYIESTGEKDGIIASCRNDAEDICVNIIICQSEKELTDETLDMILAFHGIIRNKL